MKSVDHKRPLKVFLCHAHADRDPVRGLYSRLTNDGVDAWLDKAKLLPGQDWELEIRKAVREADVVVVCLSKQFNQAGFRQKEVRLALDTAMEKPEGEIFIIPARLEECDTLESLRKWHWVDLFEDDGYEMLMRALRARANEIGSTLQVKKNWSPKIATTRPNITKPIEEKKIAHQSVEKQSQERSLSSLENETESLVKKIERERRLNARKYGLNKFFLDFRHKLNLLFINVQFYIRPILIGLGLTALLAYLLYMNLGSVPLENAAPALTTFTQRNATSTERVSITETFSPSSTPLSTEIMDAKGVPMVLVSAGTFSMGGSSSLGNSSPVHKVYLDLYYFDKYEVTNASYKKCVDYGFCLPPKMSSSEERELYYGNTEFDNFPVIYVDWNMAKSYCEWRGAQLPTEAQWEKAARGTDERDYPWGDSIDCSYANADVTAAKPNGCIGDTTSVGSYVLGKSPYGAYDMAGNVLEWVNDLYDEDYYDLFDGVVQNPLGPEKMRGNFAEQRVQRGGSWANGGPSILTTYVRYYDPPLTARETIGFRCANSDVLYLQSVATETPIPIPTSSPTPTPLPSVINDVKGVEMVLVPAGEFMAGDEKDMTNIYLDMFYVDKYEITNSLYQDCVSSGQCKSPTDDTLGGSAYFGDEIYKNYPVVWVTHAMAQEFCAWRDARLPTGSEWEKSARGIDGRRYPWGNDLRDEPLTNFCDLSVSSCYYGIRQWNINDGYQLTAPVGTFKYDKSPYNVYDMAGNVSEWVDDYVKDAYGESPVFMGGSWDVPEAYLLVYTRDSRWQSSTHFVGFRCARDIAP